ncbi:MAG: nicotinate (nicotinamide) nucleotide adenylyltransferase [Muribaculaceae bacterium]|nr:nicotinate (nicotinamide) nucleotide adenylyltransferase [Muribaculaceae bacterium]MDE6008967.1 nicotinate (nicotinamide) nucleotide adenylyltransferase [Muribaculaceae bacterium]
MRIGIYGGSFDPIHTGHAMLANYISQAGIVDELWLMVSKVNPLKTATPPASDDHRLRMASLVAEGCENVCASGFELSLPSPSFTYRTLQKLKEHYPEHTFKIIIGSDNWHEFKRWRNPDEIVREFGVIIYPRPGYEIEGKLPEGVELLEGVPTVEMSSTFVRNLIKKGKNIIYFVPRDVAEYIRRHQLYKN